MSAITGVKKITGALLLFVPYQYCCRKGLRSKVRWISVNLLNRRRRVRINFVNVSASVPIASTSDVLHFIGMGCIGAAQTTCTLAIQVKWWARSCIVAFFLKYQYECIPCWIDSDKPSIKIPMSTYSLYALKHRSYWFHNAFANSIDDVFDRWVNRILSSSI